MFFINQAKDIPLYQELIRENVISSALWESLKLPAEGHLMDVLIGHQDKISEKAWLDWLIRKHGCTRIAGLEPEYSFIKAIERSLLTDCLRCDVYPLQTGDKHLYIGLGRGDYPEIVEHLKQFFNKSIIYLNSLSLSDLGKIRNICRSSLQSV